MKTVRQQILDYIQAKGIASAIELSRALRMTPANARHHLSVLSDEGVIEVTGQRRAQGRGRPTLLYTLTRQAQAHNLDGLAGALLEELVHAQPPAERVEALRRLARRLLGETERETTSLTQRLNRAVQQLNRQHYQARWEARAEAPHLILGHCPYAAILPEHPELCQLDAALLEELLGTPVEQTARLARDSRGIPYCRFVVEKK